MSNKMVKVAIKETAEIREYKKGTSFLSIAADFQRYHKSQIVAVNVDNEIKELFHKLRRDCTIRFVDLSSQDGIKIYQRSIYFVAYVAAKRVLPSKTLSMLHSLGKGLYCEFENYEVTDEVIKKLKAEMKRIIDANIPFEKEFLWKAEAIELFKDIGREDKVKLFKFRKKDTVNIYKCAGYCNYFYGHLVPSSGYLKLFDLVKVGPGFVIRHPDITSPDKLPEYIPQNKLAQIYSEYEQWGKILGVKTVGDLNEVISSGNIAELIRISEALHEKKIAYIADMIATRKKARLVLIAGPSSSGKTTFAKRLALQLKVNGYRPIGISLDDYFVDRSKTPRDENGNYDFESIHALNLELFNKHMKALLEGNEIEQVKFDFKVGRRMYTGKKLRLEEDQLIIVEGIHGLNEVLTQIIPREMKFKIYVSALTQLNIDKDNRIPTTDTRVMRRIVRDNKFRGHTALDTIRMWPKVRKGEERNIFPFQEEADVMFNSALIYELGVLKLFAEPTIIQIDNSKPEYAEAKRLLRFIDYFLPITDLEDIPRLSIIREFIGGSAFKY